MIIQNQDFQERPYIRALRAFAKNRRTKNGAKARAGNPLALAKRYLFFKNDASNDTMLLN